MLLRRAAAPMLPFRKVGLRDLSIVSSRITRLRLLELFFAAMVMDDLRLRKAFVASVEDAIPRMSSTASGEAHSFSTSHERYLTFRIVSRRISRRFTAAFARLGLGSFCSPILDSASGLVDKRMDHCPVKSSRDMHSAFSFLSSSLTCGSLLSSTLRALTSEILESEDLRALLRRAALALAIEAFLLGREIFTSSLLSFACKDLRFGRRLCDRLRDRHFDSFSASSSSFASDIATRAPCPCRDASLFALHAVVFVV